MPGPVQTESAAVALDAEETGVVAAAEAAEGEKDAVPWSSLVGSASGLYFRRQNAQRTVVPGHHGYRASVGVGEQEFDPCPQQTMSVAALGIIGCL